MCDMLTFVHVILMHLCFLLHVSFYECWRSPLILKAFEKRFDFVRLHRLFFFALQPITEATMLLLQTREQKTHIQKKTCCITLNISLQFVRFLLKKVRFYTLVFISGAITSAEAELYLSSFACFLLKEPQKRLPVQVTEEWLHLFLPVKAVGSERADLLLLLLQPVGELSELLGRNLLAASLQLILHLVQTSLCIFGF